jgi:hypothetical protein
MLWRNNKQPETPRFQAPEPPRKRSPADVLRDSAETLAQSLNAYSDAAWRATKDEPDNELVEARAKVAAARKIVTEGRLAYALGRCLPEHIQHWASWIQRDDFLNWVGFDAQEIEAYEHQEQDDLRMVTVVTVDLKFNAQKYRLVLRNSGRSSDPESLETLGEIELWHYDRVVAHLDLTQRLDEEYPQWEYSDVRALRVGLWMKDVLDMATQVDSRRQRSINAFTDNRTLVVGKNINLERSKVILKEERSVLKDDKVGHQRGPELLSEKELKDHASRIWAGVPDQLTIYIDDSGTEKIVFTNIDNVRLAISVFFKGSERDDNRIIQLKNIGFKKLDLNEDFGTVFEKQFDKCLSDEMLNHMSHL